MFSKITRWCYSSYLSKAIATRCKMDAVQQSTSLEVHISQSSGPRVHSWLTSYTAPRGITRQATRRSATASDSMRQLATFCRLRSNRIAAMTNTFPVMKIGMCQGAVRVYPQRYIIPINELARDYFCIYLENYETICLSVQTAPIQSLSITKNN